MARAKRRTKAKPSARPRRPVLGNDPFERGAAEREPAAATPIAVPPISTASPRTPTAVTAAAPEAATAAPSATVAEAGAAPTPGHAQPEGAASRVAAVERRLEAAVEGLEARLHDLANRSGIPGAPGELREAVTRLLPAVRGRLAQALDLLRLLEPPQRLDRFGRDPRFAERLDVLVELLYAAWWRVSVAEAEHVPGSGPAVIVANHAGAVPWDAFVLRHALGRDHPARRELRPLLDDAECDLPVVGGAAIRWGAVRASADAAHAILASGDLLGVFPEGSAVARKPWRDRYRIQRFGRGGFVKVALRARAPIVPCAILGSEEASPGISRAGWLADRLGVSLLAGAAALRLGTAALLPLPSRWTLRFGAPLDLGGAGPEEADDPAIVGAIAERARTTLQGMLDEAVAARASVFL